MHRLDPPPETASSSREDRLRRKAARSLRASILTGLLAMAIFTLSTAFLLFCFLARIDPFVHRAALPGLAVALLTVPLLALASQFLSHRHVTLLRMAKEKEASRHF